MEYQDFLREMRGHPYQDLTDGMPSGRLSELSGPCRSLLSDLLGSLVNRGMDALDELAHNAFDNGDPYVNSFPYGPKTQTVCHDYIGIAIGGTSMRKVLDSTERHCWDMERHLEDKDDRTVVILTDKWDQVRFQREYEKVFLRYALRDHVLFVFLLVTDYGVSRIPFLPWDRRELKRFADSYPLHGRHGGARGPRPHSERLYMRIRGNDS